jgi:hypothetical protein
MAWPGKCEPHSYLAVSFRVRLIHGPLTALEGQLVRRKNGVGVVESLDLIRCSIALDIYMTDLQPLAQRVFLD